MSVEFIEELKKQWMAMIDAIGDPLVLLSEDLTIVRQNKAYVDNALVGSSFGELVGRKCYEVFASRTSPCTHCKIKSVLQKKKNSTWNTTELRADREFQVRVHALPADQFGKRHMVVHYQDVTDMRSIQETLARADKLAALGKLAGGVAHEINSPLAGILAFSQMALREMVPDNPHRSDMEQIEDAARKCKAIVEGLLGFARQEKPEEATSLDLIEVLQSTLRLVAPLLRKHHIELLLSISDGEKAWVKGHSGKLGQVILNLVSNAIYAMKEGGGVLEIRLSQSDSDATISVQDSGTGIDVAILGRIFDPFFTTKPVGEGTGLGLSISYSIVKQHGGEIKVVSSPGLGTTFTLVLLKG